MYRIAVIQNEVEMQHSGYVDSVPKYKERFELKVELVFNRFSSVNIRDLFREGQDYLLDYDCLIIGTNATSDGDVYNILLEEHNKEILSTFIDQGKGLLICSQKKLKKDTEQDGINVRKTRFMPEKYEYRVVSRPLDESSAAGNVYVNSEATSDIQRFIISYPNIIDDEKIKKHCVDNDFQTHYYRDFLLPINNSAYFSLLFDNKDIIRNTMMVASPQKKERVVISTMALDWAGHYELLENIVYYVMVGLPEVAFVNKENKYVEEFKFLISESELSKVSFISYSTVQNLDESNIKQYHSLFVLSPAFTEDDVSEFWNSYVGIQRKNIKLFYYKYIKNELVLVSFSLFSYVETQKNDVHAWLISKYKSGLWDNSFWKTYDILYAMRRLSLDLTPFLKGVFDDINKSHYKDGSYDGVLAPTCGLLELLSIVSQEENYHFQVHNHEKMLDETIEWLINKYFSTSTYNKKFIIRSFYKANLLERLKISLETKDSSYKFNNNFNDIALNDIVSNPKDKFEMDLCLDIDVCLIYSHFVGTTDHRIGKKVKDYINLIVSSQQQNGRWDNNLGKTARILTFLIDNKSDFEKLNIDGIEKSIELGIISLRRSYTQNNWEANLVTTANAISAIVSFDINAKYRSKDFLDRVNKEVTLSSSYNSLSLALDTLGDVIGENTTMRSKISSLSETVEKYEKGKTKLRMAISIAGTSVLLLVSYYIFLALRNWTLFVEMLTESLMWIPIVVGIAITSLVGILPNVFTKIKK